MRSTPHPEPKATVTRLLVDFRRLSAESRTGRVLSAFEPLLAEAAPALGREEARFRKMVTWYAAALDGRFGDGLLDAIRYVERLRDWQLEAPIDWLISAAGFSMGVTGLLERGLQWTFEARDLAAARGDAQSLQFALTNLASLCSVSGDYSSAEKTYRAALDLGQPKGLQRPVALNNRAFSLVCWARRLPAEDAERMQVASRALACADEALSLTSWQTDSRWVAWSIANRAHALALLARHSAAEAAYRTAIPMARANARVHATAMAGLGSLLADKGRYDEGRQLLSRAFDKAPNNLYDMIMDLVLDAWINLETRAGRTEDVAQWFRRRVQRLEEQSRTRMEEAVRQAELFESIARERALERERATKAVQESQARARKLLLQDLHDGFGSQLAIARLRAARGALPQEGLVSLLDECISDLYLVIDSIDNLQGDLAEALRMFRYRLRGRLEGGATQLHWQIELDQLAPLGLARMTHVLRIVQEALAIAFKHARASNVWVEATLGDDAALRIVVKDDGVGLPAPTPPGKGLLSMQSRATSLGGALSVSPSESGTRIELVVPR